jgi:arylsulfatase A-like enzyme
VRFAEALTPVPITLPSHATIFTGLLPPQHRVRLNGVHRLDPSYTTLAETLKGSGYATGAFVAASVLDRSRGLAQGFDTYDDAFVTEGTPGGAGSAERPAAQVTDAAMAWLERAAAMPSPFFSWIHYFDAHDPYTPPSPFDATFRDHPYDGEIAAIDHELARIVALLDQAKLRERTLIVITADHGEGLGEHGERTHAHLIYRSTMRVPLLVSPGLLLTAGTVVSDRAVSTADIVPTVLGLLGIAVPPQPLTEGGGDHAHASVSLLEAALETIPVTRAVYLETLWPHLMHGWAPIHGLSRAREKLISAPVPEFYDLVRDPGETRNLLATSSSAPGVAANELRSEMERAIATQAAPAAREKPDAATVERLRSLGYLTGEAPLAGKPPAIEPAPLADMIERWQARSDSILASSALQTENMVEMQRRAVALDATNVAAHVDLGTTYMFLKRYAEAERAFRAATRLSPRDGAVWVKLAESQGAQQNWDAFDATIGEIRAIEPDHYGIAFLEGRKLFARGSLQEARARLQEAREKAPPSEIPAIDGWIRRVEGRRTAR